MIVILLCFVTILLYLYLNKIYCYWKNKNVKHEDPVPFFGNYYGHYLGKKSLAETACELYRKFPDEKVVGCYKGLTPELHIRDLDIVRQILNTDFNYFYRRGLERDRDTEPMMKNVFNTDGDLWKLLRQRLTPAFTTGKLKAMFPLIIKCSENLQKLTEEIATTKEEFDVRELMARFTIDFIGACGFGIEMNTLNNEKSLFRELGMRIFTRKLRNRLIVPLKDMFPKYTKYLNPADVKVEQIIREILSEIKRQRDYKPSGRNDFVDLLLEYENQGTISVESIEHRNPDGSPIIVSTEMDEALQAAQLLIFFAAGFETSSSATSFTLHQLAYHPEIQNKIHDEIDRVLAKHDNKLSYDAVKEMDLLERSFQEAMRMFPSLGVLNRTCTRKYTIPNLGITIDPEVKIIIPIMAIQNDEKFFENPDIFNPDRFLDDNIKNIHKYAYLPFGEGPRACIGLRLGQMQSLAGLATILQKYRVEPSASTQRFPEVSHSSTIVQQLKHGLPLRIVKRKAS